MRSNQAKDRVMVELREGSKVLEDQLRLMDEKVNVSCPRRSPPALIHHSVVSLPLLTCSLMVNKTFLFCPCLG